MLTLLLFVGGGLGYFYLTTGKLPAKLDEAYPILLEQRKLDAKVTRLLEAIEKSTPILQHRSTESSDPGDTHTTYVPPVSDIKPDPPATIAQGQIIRK